MEKLIKLYTYVDGVHDTPFPNEESQAEVAAFRSDYKRMGGAPSISCTIMHHLCLDKMWTYNVYATFNGEKFFIKQIPSSSFDNTNARYKHEVELVSERIVLDNVYFYDVVDEADYSKPVSNSTSFTFFGDIHEFAHRLNKSLKYSKVGYNVVVDDGISSEAKQVSFQDQVFSNVLQEAFNTYEIPYYFDGKTIHIGFTNNAITKTFKYGSDESLLSIQKQNANYKIVNRVTGVGSSDNIPYYYPNFDEKGVTRLLYNGEVGGVSVTNKTRYKKVKLGDTFVYDANPTITKELFNKKDYKLGYYSDLYTPEEEGLEPGFTRFQVQFSYSFYLNEMQQVRLDLNSLSDNSIRIDFTVVRQEGGYMEQFFDKNHFEGRLGQGTYNVLITWEFKDTMSPNAIQDWQMKEIIDRDFVAYGDTTKQGYVSWMYNHAPVNLYDYGMEVNVEPNDGDKITFERVSYLQPQESLMPSIYRETNGEDRFYNALNNTYVSPQTGEYYHFNNPYINGKPKEHIVNFEDIKPTIKGMTNSNGLRIDMFTEFAYDLNDNDEFDEEGNYLHPYFFGKLRRMDGAYGFNLFDHAIEEGEMVISMTSGSCGSCEWVIGVSEDRQENIVQVDERGNLLRDANGNVIRSGSAQPQQNDTINNEVWIALKKDISTFGVVMPNTNANYKPQAGDTFVILHIDLPQAYILDAENRLKEELIKYMATNNDEKFNFSISFSRIFFAENPDILAQLNENARLQIEYDGERYELYVSSYSYSMSNDGNPLPEIRVELTDTITISQNAIQTAIDSVKQDIMSSVGSIDFLKMGLAYFLRKDVDDRSKGKIASDKAIEVGNYVSGASGAIIYKDEENGQTIAEFDKLYVRMKAYFETLEIINVNTIGGKQIISPAGSVKCIGVEEIDNSYRCYFLAEQDGEKVLNRFLVNDQIYSQMFDAVEGTSQNVSTHYFWRLCIAKSKEPVTFENKSCYYIDLSKTDCDKDSDVPMVGDVLNQRGNRTDLDRMNFIEMSSVDAFSPNITLFHGVNSYSLDGKAYVSYGVDKSTNKAFMDVYGDMYVGDRQNGSYMRYTQENGLEISGTLSVGTKLGDTPLKDLISASSPEGYQEFVEKVTQDIEGLQAQIDGAIESYFYQYDPTLGNYPASEWIANGTEQSHLNDTFTNLTSGYSWRWSFDGATYKWVEITDTATTKALALAGQAQDTADGKRRVFVDTPYPPYDLGDLWSRGSEYPLMICVNAKDKNGVYEASDFDYADNNAKLKEEMQNLVGNTKDELNNAIGQAKYEAVNNANAYTDEGKKALQESIDAMESSKANLEDVYTRAQADGKISESETNAINAAKEQADAAIALSEITIKAYADGIVDEEEAARIKQAQENLDAAKKYAEDQAQKAIDEANDTYGYLARALGTEVDGGLLLTSLIQMRDTDQNIMSGINGLTAKGDKSIATWWGGGMYDMLDYYDWDGVKWVTKKNIQIPSNVPSGVIRMDGTGYLAKGKFWWDESGKIYADPTSLFLMFDVEDESASLSQTILAMRDKQTEFESMWEFKTDANGRKYLLSKYPLVTQEGITMYSGVGTTIPSIYDGLPIDGVTIYWENGILKAQGGGGGTITEVTSAMVINALGYTPYDAKNPNGFITSSALNGYATQAWVASQGYITGITSAMVTSALGFTPYNADNFTKAKIKDTLGISDWALAESKPNYAYSEISGTPDLSVYALKTSLSSYQPLISTTNKLAYSLVSGTPTSLKNPTSLTFGSKTYDGSEAKTIVASDLGALTSHQTIYALTLQAGTFSAVKYTPNSAAKTINIPTTTAHISESGNLYFTNARAVSALSSTLASYVTLGGSQTITGAKNFTGGLSVNGGSIIYNASEGYWKLEGNLLVTGGVSMYNSGDSDIPSGGGGGSIDYPLSWSGFSSGSFDGSAAKTIYIPSKLSELTNDSGYALSSALSGYLPLSGGILDGALTIRGVNSTDDSWLQFSNKSDSVVHRLGIRRPETTYGLQYYNGSEYYNLWHSGNFNPSDYLPKSGGTITGTGTDVLHINSTYGNVNDNGTYITLQHNGVKTAEFGHGWGAGTYIKANKYTLRINNDGIGYVTNNVILHEGNYSSYALPITGGLMGGAIQWGSASSPVSINTSSGYLSFDSKGGEICVAGGNDTSIYINYRKSAYGYAPANWHIFKGDAKTYATMYVGSIYSNGNSVIHSGNIGAQSVNYASNADKLDGKHDGELTAQYFSQGKLLTKSNTINTLMSGVYSYINGDNPTGAIDDNVVLLAFRNFARTDMIQFVGAANTENLYYRRAANVGNSYEHWTNWKTIAFTDSNVESATNADKVDGYHAAGIFTYEGETYVNGESSLWNSLGTKGYANALPDGLTGAYNYGQTISFGIGNAKFDMYVSHVSTSLNYDNSGGGIYVRSGWQSDRTNWRRLAYIDSNVASATKLENNDSYTAWGQTFFVNGKPNNIFGTAYFPNGDLIYAKDEGGTSQYVLGFTSSLGLGYGSAGAGYDTYILGNNVHLRYSTSRITGFTLNSSGNVGIGTSSPSYKLDVSGAIHSTDSIFADYSIFANSWKSGCYLHGTGISWHDSTNSWVMDLVTYGVASDLITLHKSAAFYGISNLYNELAFWGGCLIQSYNSNALHINKHGNDVIINELAGNVGIGISSPTRKFQVNGIISSKSSYYTHEYYISPHGAGFDIVSTGNIAPHYATNFAIYKGSPGAGETVLYANSDKNIGIGTTAPEYKLDVRGTVQFGTGSSCDIWLNRPNGYSYLNARNSFAVTVNNNSGNIAFSIDANKNATFNGNILTSGSITMNSMRSMKNIINENGLSLEELSTIKPTRFTWKDGRDDRIHVGGIADDVMKVLPEVVFKGSDGVLSMDYASAAFVMAASLIQPMTAHERRIANLERENALLKEEIRNLKSA